MESKITSAGDDIVPWLKNILVNACVLTLISCSFVGGVLKLKRFFFCLGECDCASKNAAQTRWGCILFALTCIRSRDVHRIVMTTAIIVDDEYFCRWS